MTGFSSASGQAFGTDWTIEARSVNHKSLDVRLRVPDTLQGLDATIRKSVAAKLARGSVQISIRLGAQGDTGLPQLDPHRLEWAIAVAKQVHTNVQAAGLEPAPLDVGAVLGMRPSVLAGDAGTSAADWTAVLGPAMDRIIDDLAQMRQDEGAAL
ncbi:MAG: YicC/YloC family endoribonuclease, partial [Pseudomonadota bacterium]